MSDKEIDIMNKPECTCPKGWEEVGHFVNCAWLRSLSVEEIKLIAHDE
jgi:hypothetical protein